MAIEHPGLPSVCGEIHVTDILVFCVVFCRFVCLCLVSCVHNCATVSGLSIFLLFLLFSLTLIYVDNHYGTELFGLITQIVTPIKTTTKQGVRLCDLKVGNKYNTNNVQMDIYK